MIQARIELELAPDKVNEVLQILLSIVERTRAIAGCDGCSVYQDTQDDNRMVFEQKWLNEEDLNRYLRSEDYHRVLLVMEMAIKPPEIRFYTISSTSGVETIERARMKNEE